MCVCVCVYVCVCVCERDLLLKRSVTMVFFLLCFAGDRHDPSENSVSGLTNICPQVDLKRAGMICNI